MDTHPEYAVVSSPMIYFDETVDIKSGKGEVNAKDFIHGTPICHAPCMARTDVFKEVGGYSVDDRLLRVEDYHLWFKIFAKGYRLYLLNECLYKMRDDRNAIACRNFRNRINEAYVRHIGYKMIGLPFYTQIFSLRPIIVGLLPHWLYKLLHKH